MHSIEPKQTAEKLVAFLKQSFAKTGFTNAVIGISGGVDSATACALAVQALGTDHVFPILMPYGNQDLTVGKEVVAKFAITPITINIKPIVDPVLPKDNIRRGNLMARARMMILYDQAKEYRALVVGTENKTEYLLGYYTRFGDEASDIEPLRGLYKTQVYQLARHLGLPASVLSRAPTAGLWEGQTDEEEFGFTYKEADEILYQFVDLKQEVTGYPKDTVEKVLARMRANEFKHHVPILP